MADTTNQNNVLQQAAQGLFRSMSAGIGTTVGNIARESTANRKALSTIDNNFSKAVKQLDKLNKNITEQLQRNKFTSLESQFEKSRDQTDASLDRLEGAISNLLGALGGAGAAAAGGLGGMPLPSPSGNVENKPKSSGDQSKAGGTDTKPAADTARSARPGPAWEAKGRGTPRSNVSEPAKPARAAAQQGPAFERAGRVAPKLEPRLSIGDTNVRRPVSSSQAPKPGTAPRAPSMEELRFKNRQTKAAGVSSVRPGSASAGMYDPLGSFKPGATLRPPSAADIAYKWAGKVDAVGNKILLPLAAGIETWAGFNEYMQYRMQYDAGQLSQQQFANEVNRIVAKYPARFLTGWGASIIGSYAGQSLFQNRWMKMAGGTVGGVAGWSAGSILAGHTVDILAGKTTIRDAIYNETGIDIGRGNQQQAQPNPAYNYSTSQVGDWLTENKAKGFTPTPQTYYLGGVISGAPPHAARTAGESLFGGQEGDVEASSSEGVETLHAASSTIDLNKFLDPSKRGTQHATGLNPQFAGSLGQMLSEAQAAGMNIQIGSGYRSIQRQQELWNSALQRYGSPSAARRWVAPPGRSKHNFGTAADLWVNGKRLGRPGTERETQWAHANASKYGLNFRMSHEPWHIEPGSGGSAPMGVGMGSMAGNVPTPPSGVGGGVGTGYPQAASFGGLTGGMPGLQGASFGMPMQGLMGGLGMFSNFASMFGGGFGMLGGLGGMFGSLLSLGSVFSSFGNMFGKSTKPIGLESNQTKTALREARGKQSPGVPERRVMINRQQASNQETASVSQPTVIGQPKQQATNEKNVSLKNMMSYFNDSIGRANFAIDHYITSEQNPSFGLA